MKTPLLAAACPFLADILRPHFDICIEDDIKIIFADASGIELETFIRHIYCSESVEDDKKELSYLFNFIRFDHSPRKNTLPEAEISYGGGDHGSSGDAQGAHGEAQGVHGEHHGVHGGPQGVHGGAQGVHGGAQGVHGGAQGVHGEHHGVHGGAQGVHGGAQQGLYGEDGARKTLEFKDAFDDLDAEEGIYYPKEKTPIGKNKVYGKNVEKYLKSKCLTRTYKKHDILH